MVAGLLSYGCWLSLLGKTHQLRKEKEGEELPFSRSGEGTWTGQDVCSLLVLIHGDIWYALQGLSHRKGVGDGIQGSFPRSDCLDCENRKEPEGCKWGRRQRPSG